MGMTLKELLTKGEGTLTAGEAKTLASQCRMDVETLYTLLEERGIKILDDEADGDTSLDVEGIMAEVESAEANSDELGLGDENEDDPAEENPADLKAAMDELPSPKSNAVQPTAAIPHISVSFKRCSRDDLPLMTPIRAPVPDALPIDLPSSANEQISPVPISPPSSKTNEMFCFTPRPTILFFSITVPAGNRVPGKIKEPSPRLHWAPMILPAPTVTFIPATVFSQITELFILLPSPIFTPLYNILPDIEAPSDMVLIPVLEKIFSPSV